MDYSIMMSAFLSRLETIYAKNDGKPIDKQILFDKCELDHFQSNTELDYHKQVLNRDYFN